MKKWMHGLLALVMLLSFSALSPLAFAGEEKKEEKQDKGSKVVLFGEEKKEEKKGKDGK